MLDKTELLMIKKNKKTKKKKPEHYQLIFHISW